MTETTVAPGTSHTQGVTHTLRFTLHLPHPVERVWQAVATRAGLPTWLAAADELEPRVGGAITLRWLNGDGAHPGQVTAWDVERVAEYTLPGLHGRARFHLEAPTGQATTLRFTNEFHGDDALRLDSLAGWHDHFLCLCDALEGRPMTEADWRAWTPERWRRLRDAYENRT